MSLKGLQTRIITAPPGSGFSLTGFIVASFRTWQWRTSAPSVPVELKSIALSVGATATILLVGTIAYITSGKLPEDSTVYIFNVANPQNPVLLGTGAFPVGTNPVTQLAFASLDAIGTTVYMTQAAAFPPGGITIMNASNPAAPTASNVAPATITTALFLQAHGSLVYILGTDTHTRLGIYNSALVQQSLLDLEPNAPSSASFLINFPYIYAAVTGTPNSHLYVIDVNDPSSPQLKSTTVIPVSTLLGNRQQILSLDGTTLYVMSQAIGNQQVFVYDVSGGFPPAFIKALPLTDPSLSGGVSSYFVASGCINMTSGTGPINLTIYDTGGNVLGSSVVRSAASPISSGCILRAA